MRLRLNLNFKIGKIVRYFILADLALMAGWGMIAPVFSVFIIQRIFGATLVTVGLAAAIYWITKSLVQIPIALMLDKTPSERDDYIFLVSGLMLAGVTAISFALIDRIWQLFLVELLHAIAFACYVPSWSGMFARHLDKDHRSLDFTLDSTMIGLASGVTGLISGILATWLGFNAIFIIAGLLSFVSAGIIFASPELVFPHRRHRGIIIRNHTPKTVNQ